MALNPVAGALAPFIVIGVGCCSIRFADILVSFLSGANAVVKRHRCETRAISHFAERVALHTLCALALSKARPA